MNTASGRENWGNRNRREAEWLKEFIVRKELGCYPQDPLKADFFLGIINIQNKNIGKQNSYQHLKNLIQKNR